jgi:hypothetical protein
MKVVAFNVPKIRREAFRYQEDKGAHFYDQLHQHPEIQIMLIIKGEGTLIAGDYVGRFVPGDLYVIGSNMPHVFRSDKEYFAPKSHLQVNAMSIYFNEKYWGDAWQLDEMKMVRKFFEKSARGFLLKGKLQTSVAEDIRRLKHSRDLDKLIVFL